MLFRRRKSDAKWSQKGTKIELKWRSNRRTIDVEKRNEKHIEKTSKNDANMEPKLMKNRRKMMKHSIEHIAKNSEARNSNCEARTRSAKLASWKYMKNTRFYKVILEICFFVSKDRRTNKKENMLQIFANKLLFRPRNVHKNIEQTSSKKHKQWSQHGAKKESKLI